MTTYRRRGHWRRGKDGGLHWVSEHSVTRTEAVYGRWTAPPPRLSARSPRTGAAANTTWAVPVLWDPVPSAPNSRCPACGAPVWFFRNWRGGCAYFDALGPPWPLHPCMDLSTRSAADRQAVRDAKAAYQRTERARASAAAAEARRRRVAERESARARKRTAAAERRASRSEAARVQDTVTDEKLEPTYLPGAVAMAALFAWVLSLPLSYWVHGLVGGWLPEWIFHWLVTIPTALLLPALLRYLVAVPPKRPPSTAGAGDGWLVGHAFVGLVLLAAAIAANTLSLGLALPLTALKLFTDAPKARAAAARARADTGNGKNGG